MIKLNLRWVFISLVLIAPYVELARVINENYHQIPELNKLWGSIGANEVLSVLFSLKYFFLLFGIGLATGWKKGLISDDFQNRMSFFTIVYLYVLSYIIINLIICVIVGLVDLFQLYPFIFISLFLISLSLMTTRARLFNKCIEGQR